MYCHPRVGRVANGPRVRHDPEGVGSSLSQESQWKLKRDPRCEDPVGLRDYLFCLGLHLSAIRVGVHEVSSVVIRGDAIPLRGNCSLRMDDRRGERSPTARQWTSVSLLAVLIFVLDYGSLFWAEQRVPSGIAAVMLATIPAFMALSEVVFLKTQRLTLRLGTALVIGIAGVAMLMAPWLRLSGAPMTRSVLRH